MSSTGEEVRGGRRGCLGPGGPLNEGGGPRGGGGPCGGGGPYPGLKDLVILTSKIMHNH